MRLALRSRGRWAALALVVLVFVASALWRTHLFQHVPAYDPRTDRLLFWTESAFHYRYAKMTAFGEPIPELDRRAEMPDGVRPFSQFTIGMELVSGTLYRVLDRAGIVRVPFHVFLVHFICWFSSLSILAAFLAARSLWRHEGAAAAAALLYAVCPVSYHRVIGNYGLEDFTLPLLFFFVAFFFRSLRSDSRRRRLLEACVAGFFAAASLATWHLSRFFFLAFAPVVPILVLFGGNRERLRDTVWITAACQLAACLAVPVLVEKRAALSSAMLAFYAASIVLPLSARRRWYPIRTGLTIAIAWLLLLAAGSALLQETEYTHVSTLIRYKLQYLGSKPDDPAVLPFEARTFWAPPFNSPSPGFLVTMLGFVAPWFAAGAVAAGVLLARRRSNPETAALLYLVLVFFFSFLLVERLSVFPIFFLALLAAGLLTLSRRRRVLLLLLLLASAAFQAREDARGASAWTARLGRALVPPADGASAPNLGNNRRLVEWMHASTGPDDVFLTWYPTGPMVLVYGERPIVLHSKFESSVIRNRYRSLLEALYGTEDEMADLCERLRVDYFVFQANFVLDTTRWSELYGAGLRALPSGSAAFLFHFYPEELRRFELVYQDSYYRVFHFGKGVPLPHRLPREGTWESILPPREDPLLDPAVVTGLLEILHRRGEADERASRALARGDLTTADLSVDDILAVAPDAEEAFLIRARIAWLREKYDRALELIDLGLETRPESAELWCLKGEILLDMKKPVRAGKAFAAALVSNPDHPDARTYRNKIESAVQFERDRD